MLTSYSKLINSKIFDLKDQSNLGDVAEVIYRKGELIVQGMVLKRSFFSREVPVVETVDIVEVTHGALIINNDQGVYDINEAIRLKESYKHGFLGINQNVITKSGKKIGKVIDFIISTDDFTVEKILVRGVLSERLIPKAAVVSYHPDTIVIKNEFEKVKITTPVMESTGA